MKVWIPHNLRRIYYKIQALFIDNNKKNTLTKCVWVIDPRNGCIIQSFCQAKKWGSLKGVKEIPLVNAFRKERKERVLNTNLIHLIGCIIQWFGLSVRYARQKKFFQTHTPIIESGLSNSTFFVYFIVIFYKFSTFHHYSPP